MNGLEIPVALQYSSDGFKVDENPGRLGVGWNLSCNGVLTRIVHGRPDDGDQVQRQPSLSSNPSQQDVEDYYYQLSDKLGNGDLEPDEFNVSAPGLSTKFILDDDGQIIQIPYSNIKIEIVKNSAGLFDQFTLTNTNGIKYIFGGVGGVELAHNIQIEGLLKRYSTVRTAFFLKKIIIPNGQYIDFSYSGGGGLVYNGISESVTRGATAPPEFCNSGTVTCPSTTVDYNSYAQHVSSANYTSFNLSDIFTSTGEHIEFVNDVVTETVSGNTAPSLKTVEITAGDYHRTYNLEYAVPAMTSVGYRLSTSAEGAFNPRIFLTEVNYAVSSDANVEHLKYKIDWVSYTDLPYHLSYAQDKLGYYNGSNNTYFMPPIAGQTAYWGPFASADREFHASFAMKGMVKKITFPTGGYEEYTLEPNTVTTAELLSTSALAEVDGSGDSPNGTPNTLTYYSATFEIKKHQTASFTWTFGANPACTGSCPVPTGNGAAIMHFYILDVNTGISQGGGLTGGYESQTGDVILDPGVYELKLSVAGIANYASAQLNYDPTEGPDPHVYVNYEAGGVRVKQITSYDPVSNKASNKYYFYNKITELPKSSGNSNYPTDFIQPSFFRKNCGTGLQDGAIQCANYVLSSNSIAPLSLFSNHICYEYVTEADDLGFKNGAIQHKYDKYNPFLSQNVFGFDISNVPRNIISSTYGYETETETFNKDLQTVKKIVSTYDFDPTYSKGYVAKTFRKRFEPFTGIGSTITLITDPVDETDYTYSSFWVQLQSVVSTDYDNSNSLQNSVTYHYKTYGSANPTNILPIKTETTNSKGETIAIENTYPTDFPTNSTYQAMVAKNIVTPTIETIEKKNNVPLIYSRTDYSVLPLSTGGPTPPNSLQVFEPQNVVVKKGSNSEETRIRYYSYDEKANPLELSKESDIHIAYIWDYENRFPVAEVKNATQADIAYTSFESIGLGNWTISNPEPYSASGITGKWCGAAILTKSVQPSKTYIVSAWVKEGSTFHVSMNSTSGTLITTKNNWKLYKWEVTNVSTVTVDGVGIDEVRLYPKEAQMTTYTYAPFVGITTACDASDHILYYEYDDAYRLLRIRDVEQNIIKQFDYQYKKSIVPCPNMLANWQPTGATHCTQTGANNNFNGNIETEYIDLNNCSATYLTKQWIATTSSNCQPVANCTGAGNRVIVVNGVAGCYPGLKVLVKSIKIGTQWHCTFHYYWQEDGFVGPDFDETHTTICH